MQARGCFLQVNLLTATLVLLVRREIEAIDLWLVCAGSNAEHAESFSIHAWHLRKLWYLKNDF